MQYINKELKEKIKALKNIPEDKLPHYIITQYHKDISSFHKIFLHSGIIFSLNDNTFDQIINLLKKLNAKKTYLYDILFFKSKIQILKIYDKQISKLIEKIPADALIGYIEFINAKMFTCNQSYDLKEYPKEILHSQKEFILDNFASILMEINSKIKYNNKYSYKNEPAQVYELLKTITHKYSLKYMILSVCMEKYKPVPVKPVLKDGYLCIYYEYKHNKYLLPLFESSEYDQERKYFFKTTQVFLSIYNQYFWKPNELYRDLNLRYFSNHLLTIEDSLELGSSSGLMNYNQKSKTMHINGNYFQEYNILSNNLKVEKILFQLYGDIKKTSFTYKKMKYTVKELSDLFLIIQRLSNQILEANINKIDKKNYTFFNIIGIKKLYRLLNITTEKQKELLELLITDIHHTNFKESNNKLIYKSKDLYYFIPSKVDHTELTNTLDTILTRKDIEPTLSIERGIQFEIILEDLIKRQNFKFFKLKKDELKNSPEIDGIFLYDDYLFVYEAKAGVIPHNEIEAYNYLNSIIYEKAYEQLNIRINYILNNITLFEKKFNITIDTRKIIPLIITNHATLTGYKGLYLKQIDKEVPIIDYDLFRFCIEDKKILSWKYDNSLQKYTYDLINLESSSHFYSFLLEPYQYLNSIDKPVIQLSEDGIAKFIVKGFSIT